MISNFSSDQGWTNALSTRSLTQSISLEEAKLPPLFLFAVIMIGSLMLLFIGWASLTKVEETANAAGQVVPSDYIQSIQHLDGGIIKAIQVKEGDLVEAGQVLFLLDATNADADLGQMQARQKALQSQAGRLRNFVAGNMDQPLDSEESAILSSMIDARTGQENVLRDQIAQKQKELAALKSTSDALEKNVMLVEKETAMHRQMAAQGIGSQLMALNSERDLNQIQGQLGEIAGQQNRANDAIREARNRLHALGTDLKSDAMKNLGTVEAELAEVNNAIAKVRSAADRTTIKAPVRGIVKGLNVHTIGAVIEPGKILMEIVPVEKDLEVEAMVSPRDVGHLKDGQPVKVKISAYDFSRYGNVAGTLKNISASTFQNEDKESFYKARIALCQNHVGQDARRNLILPGMTVEANIVTGDKTILQYLLKPLHVAASTAFREN